MWFLKSVWSMYNDDDYVYTYILDINEYVNYVDVWWLFKSVHMRY